MNDKPKYHLIGNGIEVIAYELFKELKHEIISEREAYNEMSLKEKQEYLLQLFKVCLEVVQGVRPDVIPKITSSKD